MPHGEIGGRRGLDAAAAFRAISGTSLSIVAVVQEWSRSFFLSFLGGEDPN